MDRNNITTGIRHPSLAFRALYRSAFGGGRNSGGIDVFEQDWDNLIILDACRADVFRRVAAPHFDGSFTTKTSKGSATVEWVRQNFTDRTLTDTVYVSANGWLHRIQDEINAVIHAGNWLYSDEYRNEMGTVPPESVTDKALDWVEKYPNKRLLVHYVQPHKPFVGETAERHFSHARGVNMVEMMARAENASTDTLRRAYRETLETALPEVKRLVAELDGKTVISADHGELLGERYPLMPLKNYGHPVGIYVPELVNVPWFELEYESRREITKERPDTEAERDEEQLQEHLKAMGYM